MHSARSSPVPVLYTLVCVREHSHTRRREQSKESRSGAHRTSLFSSRSTATVSSSCNSVALLQLPFRSLFILSLCLFSLFFFIFHILSVVAVFTFNLSLLKSSRSLCLKKKTLEGIALFPLSSLRDFLRLCLSLLLHHPIFDLNYRPCLSAHWLPTACVSSIRPPKRQQRHTKNQSRLYID